MNDPRKNLPSCSSLHRLAACPGSFHLERAVKSAPGYVEPQNEMASRGDRIHAWLKDPTSIQLDGEELDIAESIREIEQKTMVAWAVEGQPIMVKREERMWFKRDGEEIFSGQEDVLFLQGNRALILDAKSGFIKAPHSSVNYQLAGLAVILAETNPHVHSVDVGIVQPFVSHKVELTHYESRDLVGARAGILSTIEGAKKPDAPFKTGDHCNYCAASMVCEARQKELRTIAAVTIHEPDLTVSNEDLVALLDCCGRATKLIGEIRGEAKRRIEAGETLEGWELVTGKGRRKVSDIVAVSERLNEAGASWTDIVAQSSITIGAVKDLSRAASGKKGMALTKFVDGVLSGATSTGDAKPRLQRVGAAIEDSEDEP